MEPQDLKRVCEISGFDVARIQDWSIIAEEIEKEHRIVMEQRFLEALEPGDEQTFVYPGFPNVREPVNLSGLSFVEELRLMSIIFTQRVSFGHSVFAKTVSFLNAVFNKSVSFSNGTCLGDFALWFSTVSHEAFFGHATFKGSAYFNGVVFDADAFFHSATFEESAAFERNQFRGPVRFSETKFGLRDSKKVCVPDFTDTMFEKQVDFRNADFCHYYPVLRGTIFYDKVLFSAKEKWPSKNLKLGSVVDEKTPEKPTCEVGKESCGIIRHAIAQQGLPEDEHFFFRREMGFAAQIGGWWQRLPYRVFGLLSNFGESIARPSLALLALWVMPALVLLCCFAWVGVMGDSNWSRLDAWGLSFANIFTVFGFHRLYFEVADIQKLHWLLQLMGALQTVLALPLLFFLGLALRKRFRLR